MFWNKMNLYLLTEFCVSKEAFWLLVSHIARFSNNQGPGSILPPNSIPPLWDLAVARLASGSSTHQATCEKEKVVALIWKTWFYLCSKDKELEAPWVFHTHWRHRLAQANMYASDSRAYTKDLVCGWFVCNFFVWFSCLEVYIIDF